MSNTTETAELPAKPRIGRTTIKLVWLAGLVIASLLPNYLTTNLIAEREGNEKLASQAITRGWAPKQAVIGPMLMVEAKTGAPKTTGSYFHLAPKTLEASFDIVPERRHRGFFDATVYTATIHVKGTFQLPDSNLVRGSLSFPMPDAGYLTFIVSDHAGVTTADHGSIGGAEAPWKHLPDGQCSADEILVVPVNLAAAGKTLPFEGTLHLRATKFIALAPLARALDATIKGNWTSPSFIDTEPPLDTSIGKDGFAAHWHLDDIDAASYTASTCIFDMPKPTTTLGVNLDDGITPYRMVTRAAKYAPLFVVFACAAYFTFELLSGVAISILQYALMAASLTLFALLLTAFSEVIGYTPGFAASAALVTAQAAIYTGSVTRRARPAVGFGALLAGLFGCLYVLIGLENYALLTGTIALFVTLSIVMGVTQRVQKVA